MGKSQRLSLAAQQEETATQQTAREEALTISERQRRTIKHMRELEYRSKEYTTTRPQTERWV